METLAEVYDEFHNDLKDFLKAETADTVEAEQKFERMQEKYPSTLWDSRRRFFPSHRDGDYLVSPPERNYEPDISVDSDFGQDIAEYLTLEERGKGLEALEKLVDMKADYDHVWDERRLLFFPPDVDETRVSMPGLESLVQSYNERLGEEGRAEREFIVEFIEENFRYEGTFSKTVYIGGDTVAFLDEDSELPEGEIPMQVVDSFYDAMPMMELIENIELLDGYEDFEPVPGEKETSTWDSTGTGNLQRLLGEYYYTGSVLLDESPSDVYEVYHDPVDGLVVLWGSDAAGDEKRIISDEEVLMDMEAMEGGHLFNDVMESRPLFDDLL